jgi:hypothetical protein
MDHKNRRHLLKQFHQALNTAEGQELMTELKSHWHDANPLDSCPQTMGYNIGMSECYKQLEAWQAGEGLHE